MDAKQSTTDSLRNALRSGARATALQMVDQHLDVGCTPGFFGRLELVLQDGVVEKVRFERIDSVRPLKKAA